MDNCRAADEKLFVTQTQIQGDQVISKNRLANYSVNAVGPTNQKIQGDQLISKFA